MGETFLLLPEFTKIVQNEIHYVQYTIHKAVIYL
jgi:hypothetical protein